MKKTSRKRLIAIIFSICVIIFIYFVINIDQLALGNKNQPEILKNKKRIVFVSPQTDYPVWLQAKLGFDAAAKDLGFYGIWAGGGNCNINDMLREIDIALAEKVDGIITCPLNPKSFTKAFEDIYKHNIPLINIAVDAEVPELRTAFIGTDSKELGIKQAKYLHDKVGDNMKIGIIMSNIDTQNQVIQSNALKEYIKNIPSAKVIAVDEDWSDPVIGISVFSRMIEEHPEINAVFGTEGGGVSGFAKVIKDKNLEGKITVIGMDIIEDNLKAIKERYIYGVMSQDFYKMGYLAGEYAYRKSLGMDVPKVTYTGTELITYENLNNINGGTINEN